MMNTSSNLRKAAVLMRSVDADTAATLLGQLSPAEAAAVREAIRSLGPIDADEQADLLAEFRRASPLASEPVGRGVELALSSLTLGDMAESGLQPAKQNGKRFGFLEDAPISGLASYLAREHAQTIAVVLSHLAPARAAAVLAALPTKLQYDTFERLSVLGDTDAESVTVLEHELTAWVRERGDETGNRARRRDTVTSILAAADAKTRDGLLANLKTHDSALADQLAPPRHDRSTSRRDSRRTEHQAVASTGECRGKQQGLRNIGTSQPPVPRPLPPPHLDFDQIIHLDVQMLARLLGAADPNVLSLALAGSSDELVDRVCAQMPKRVAKEFRRELRRLGPTRLSDVEAAQRAIADLAAQHLAKRQPKGVFSLV